jgi:hypothetical protein
MAVLVIAVKAELALAVGLVPLNSVSQVATVFPQVLNHKCCFYATNLSHKCILALVAFCFLGYNIYLNGEIMTLDDLIFKLDVIRAQAGHGNLQVLFRDPGLGMLYDEINPYLTEVLPEDNLDMFDAFDLELNDYYVEL